MSLFYKVGLTQKEVASGKGLTMLNIEADLLVQNMQLFLKEKGNVLVYFSNDNSEEFFNIYYIKDSIYPFYSAKMNFNVIEIIDEKDLPNNLGVSISL